MKFLKVTFRTLKGFYDIFAAYLLVFIIPFAIFAFSLHLISDFVAVWFEFADATEMWDSVGKSLGIHSAFVRLAVYLPFHAVAFWALKKPLTAVRKALEAGFDKLVRGFNWFTTHFPWGRLTGELAFSLALTALFVPFIVQPTLVPGYFSAMPWAERSANLLDGTATASLSDSVVGLYRKFYTEPVVAPGVPKDQLDKMFVDVGSDASGPVMGPKPTGKQPMMDRWDPYIRKAAAGDDAKYAYIKSFMWTESGGRQYAVSHTGCSGLMQFCTGTARAQPFKSVFGTGTVYRCKCNGPCKVPRDTQKDLETGDPDAIERQKNRFPCDMTDARFNPTKAITAGGLYVDKLRKAVGGNIYLMYIGYNSGPRVAAKVYKAGGSNPDMSLEDIAIHLPDALRPHFGGSSNARARSLVRTHLPKIKKAYNTYYGG